MLSRVLEEEPKNTKQTHSALLSSSIPQFSAQFFETQSTSSSRGFEKFELNANGVPMAVTVVVIPVIFPDPAFSPQNVTWRDKNDGVIPNGERTSA